MTSEDKVAAKLTGHNCLIKFLDGEELPVTIGEAWDNEDGIAQWFLDMEIFLNSGEGNEYCPIGNIAIARNTVKYVKRI